MELIPIMLEFMYENEEEKKNEINFDQKCIHKNGIFNKRNWIILFLS